MSFLAGLFFVDVDYQGTIPGHGKSVHLFTQEAVSSCSQAGRSSRASRNVSLYDSERATQGTRRPRSHDDVRKTHAASQLAGNPQEESPYKLHHGEFPGHAADRRHGGRAHG